MTDLPHSTTRHHTLAKVLRISTRHSQRLFELAAKLCDPFTQPEENDQVILSLDTLLDVFIALTFNPDPSSETESEGDVEVDSPTPHFDLGYRLMGILEQVHFKLNCYDDPFLRSINNDSEHEQANLRLWTPSGISTADLTLLYTITCLITLVIHKLYAANNNIFLNPFLGYFLKLWKCHTNVVVLGLDVDRRDEACEGPGTPEIVRAVVHGSSAVRVVVASILNGDISKALVHDFQHELILTFMNPLGRKLASGSLTCDIRWYVTAMLSLGADLVEVTELLYDMEPNDVYDEDVKYMFDFDYDDGSEAGDEPPRCDCEFDYEYYDEEPGSGGAIDDGLGLPGLGDDSGITAPTAVRLAGDLDFDSDGRDWRDIPRGDNVHFNPTLTLDDVMNMLELASAFSHMAERVVSDTLGRKVIRTVARSVREEYEEQIRLAELGPAAREALDTQPEDPEVVTPDKIYDLWSVESKFEPGLRLNPGIASCMMDEMLMAHGYRRVLIWFLTHLEVSHHLINYIHELLSGQRGAVPSNKHPFSRMGVLRLSDVERNMLLHEFLSNATTYLVSAPDTRGLDVTDSRVWNRYHTRGSAQRLMEILCLMIESLVTKGVLDVADPEYRVELQTLLIQWVGLLPHARNLFFRTRGGEPDDDLLANFDEVHHKIEQSSTSTSVPVGSKSATPSKGPSASHQSSSQGRVPCAPLRQSPHRQVGSASLLMENGALAVPLEQLKTADTIDQLCSKMISGLPEEFSEELMDFLTQFKELSGEMPAEPGVTDRIEDWVKPQDLQKLEELLVRASKVGREGLEARITELDSNALPWDREDDSLEGEGEFALVLGKKKKKKKKGKKK